MRILAALATAFLLAMGATTATAAPLVYTYQIDNQSGSLLAVPFTAATVRFRVLADSTTLSAATVFGIAGQCVTATAADVSVNNAAPVGITQQIYVCQTNGGLYLGVYPDLGTSTASHSDLTIAGVNLAVPGGPYTVPAGGSHNSGSLTVTGGTYVFGPSNQNTAASFFSIAPQAVPAGIPTMSEWALILFGLILAGGAALYVQRRRFSV